jgi:hypothetical protein
VSETQQADVPTEMYVNPVTGEVEENWRPENDDADVGVMVPLNLRLLSESDVVQAFPTAGELEQALLASRVRLGRAAPFIVKQSESLKKAKRDLVVARAVSRQNTREGGLFKTEKDVDAAIDRDTLVYRAVVRVDDAAMKLEYARELKSSLHADIEILRSLNTNMRNEVRSPSGR